MGDLLVKHQKKMKFGQNHRWICAAIFGVTFSLYLLSSSQISVLIYRKTSIHLEKTEILFDPKFENETKNENISIKMQNYNLSQIYQLVESESNLPLTYWNKWKNIPSLKPSKSDVTYCAQVRLTDPYKLSFNNRIWQVFRSREFYPKQSDVTMYLLNAYYDNRIFGSPVVKLLSVNNQEQIASKREWWCLLWFENQKSPILVKASDYYTLWNIDYYPNLQAGVNYPQLITCPIPSALKGSVPRVASLQSNRQCNTVESMPSNTLRVIYNRREKSQSHKTDKPRIGVCVKAFRYGSKDMSVRLVEWLEMIRLMGAEQVHFYVYSATENTEKVINHYRDEGFVDLRRMTLSGNQINIPLMYILYANWLDMKKSPQDLVDLNDCLYRNMYLYDYIAVLDVDEVIMPQQVDNWHQLINVIESRLSKSDLKHKSYYAARHSHVCEAYEDKTYQNEPIPDYLYMFRHTQRNPALPYENPKSIIRTDLVTALHNHFPLRCIDTTGYEGCERVLMRPSDGVLLHYRKNQTVARWLFQNNACTIKDDKNWRFFSDMATRVRQKLDEILLLK